MQTIAAAADQHVTKVCRYSQSHSWDSECQFVDAAVRSLAAEGSACRVVLKEFRTTFGIPDILVLEYDPGVAFRRQNRFGCAEVRLTHQAARLMALLAEHAWDSNEALRSASRFTPKSFDRAADCLRARGLIDNSKGRLNARTFNGVFFLKTATAYEAKLRDWRRGIAQAHRHLWFTDHSYLLVPPGDKGREARIAACCSAAGVGMAVLNERVHPLLPASGRYLARHWLTWLLNEELFDIKMSHAERICA